MTAHWKTRNFRLLSVLYRRLEVTACQMAEKMFSVTQNPNHTCTFFHRKRLITLTRPQ